MIDKQQFDKDGFLIVHDLLLKYECARLAAHFSNNSSEQIPKRAVD